MFNKKLVVALLCAPFALTGALAQPLQPLDVIGTWSSATFENLGGFYGTREFVLNQHEWTVVFKGYADAQGTKPLFTMRAEGQYNLLGASAKVPGATEAVFWYTARFVTAESEAGVALFKSMNCTLKPQQVKDVTLTGCGFIAPVGESAVEYDLLKKTGNRLYFGDRSGDLSKVRPQKLGLDPVVRREGR